MLNSNMILRIQTILSIWKNFKVFEQNYASINLLKKKLEHDQGKVDGIICFHDFET